MAEGMDLNQSYDDRVIEALEGLFSINRTASGIVTEIPDPHVQQPDVDHAKLEALFNVFPKAREFKRGLPYTINLSYVARNELMQQDMQVLKNAVRRMSENREIGYDKILDQIIETIVIYLRFPNDVIDGYSTFEFTEIYDYMNLHVHRRTFLDNCDRDCKRKHGVNPCDRKRQRACSDLFQKICYMMRTVNVVNCSTDCNCNNQSVN